MKSGFSPLAFRKPTTSRRWSFDMWGLFRLRTVAAVDLRLRAIALALRVFEAARYRACASRTAATIRLAKLQNQRPQSRREKTGTLDVLVIYGQTLAKREPFLFAGFRKPLNMRPGRFRI